MKKTLLTLFVFIIFMVFSGCSSSQSSVEDNSNDITNKNKKEENPLGHPTEKEVTEQLKVYYENCIPGKEWNEKKSSMHDPDYDKRCNSYSQMGDKDLQEECSEKKAAEKEAFKAWADGRSECDDYRENKEDRFISFKKTDGKEINVFGGTDYIMYGTLTMFDSESGKEKEHKEELTFALRESGWVEYYLYETPLSTENYRTKIKITR